MLEKLAEFAGTALAALAIAGGIALIPMHIIAWRRDRKRLEELRKLAEHDAREWDDLRARADEIYNRVKEGSDAERA